MRFVHTRGMSVGRSGRVFRPRLLAGGDGKRWRTHNNSGDVSPLLSRARLAIAYFWTVTVTSVQPPPVTCAVIVVSDALFCAGVTVSWFVWLPPTAIVTGDGATV
jgi:hypothetical protein